MTLLYGGRFIYFFEKITEVIALLSGKTHWQIHLHILHAISGAHKSYEEEQNGVLSSLASDHYAFYVPGGYFLKRIF